MAGLDETLGLLFLTAPKEKPRPGVISALQAFETALMLASLGRWPSVIPLTWSACESLLRSKYNALESDTSYQLQNRYYDDTNLLESLHNKAHKFRRLRNTIQHEGFSTRDDAACIEMFFDTGIPYFHHLVKTNLGESLTYKFCAEGHFESLLGKIRTSVTSKKPSNDERKMIIIFLQKFLRRTLSPNFFSAHDDLVIDESYQGYVGWDAEWTLKSILCDKLEALTGHDGLTYEMRGVDCPVCNEWIFAVLRTSEVNNEYKFEAMVGLGCWQCAYVLSVEQYANVIRAFFLEQLSKELITTIESDTPHLARETFNPGA